LSFPQFCGTGYFWSNPPARQFAWQAGMPPKRDRIIHFTWRFAPGYQNFIRQLADEFCDMSQLELIKMVHSSVFISSKILRVA